jgi:Fe-S-cluster containining protein
MVPFSKLELSGISWYTTEVMNSQSFDLIIPRLLNHKKTTECPFLLEGLCSIYHVRPIACRIFFVFNTPCDSFEDVSLTRPADIFTHSRETAKRVAMRFLDSDFYGLKTKRDKEKAFEDGFIVKTSRQMHHIDWTGFAKAAEKLRHYLFQPF